jgi:anti-sigma-K factor RskA
MKTHPDTARRGFFASAVLSAILAATVLRAAAGPPVVAKLAVNDGDLQSGVVWDYLRLELQEN